MDKALENDIKQLVDGAVKQALTGVLSQLKTQGGMADLAKAYVAAVGEIGMVAKDAVNPHFNSNYATLGAVLAAGKPVFAKYKLALLQAPGPIVNDKVALVGMVIHESGQYLSFTAEIPVGKLSAQAVGSAIKYARRYQASAVFGLTDVDDDGNAATEAETSATSTDAPAAKKPAKEKKADPSYAAALAALLAEIEAAAVLGEDGSTTEGELSALKPAVVDLDDNQTTEAYIARRKVLKKAKK